MRGLRRIGLLMASLLVVLLGVALVLPPLWDWSRQRETMEAFAAAALGRPVRIEGAISLTLLPEPTLSAGRVQVLGDSDGGELRIRSLRLGVALWPLLRGRVVAKELVLRGPELRLPWPLVSPAAALPAWYAGFAGRIEDGQISIGAVTLRDIQASLTATEDGTLSIAGRLPLMGQPWQLSARIGQPASDGMAAADITLTGRDRAMGHSAALAGSLGGTSVPRGMLSVYGPDLSLWLPAPAMAFRAEGELRLGAEGWVWRDIGLDLGGMPMRAALDLAWTPTPTLRGHVTAPRMDLDAWGPALWRLRGAGVPITVDVAVDAATFAGGTLRQLHGNIAAADGVIRVTEGRAILPGDTALRLAGQIRLENDAPMAEGQASIDATDPRAGLRWLTGIWKSKPPELPAEMLRSLSLSTDIALAAGTVTFSNLTGRIDKTQWRGDIAIQPGSRPSVRVALAGDQISLDPVAAHGLPKPAAIWDGLAGTSLDLQLRLNGVTVTGRIISNVVLDARAEPERLLLRRLEGITDGARFSGSGSFGVGGNLADGKLEVSSDNAQALAGWVPAGWQPATALWDGRMVLRADVAGTMEALTVQLGLDLGDARLEAQPVIDLSRGNVAGRFSLRHPNAMRLVAALDPSSSGPPDWLGEGSFALQTQFNLRDRQVSVDHFDLTAGSLRGNGRVGVSWQDGVRRFDGGIIAETLPLPWQSAQPDDALPGQWLRGWAGTLRIQANHAVVEHARVMDKLVCMLAQEAGVTRLSDCTARIADGEAKIDASLDAAANPPVLIADIDIKNGRLPDMLAGDDRGAFGVLAQRTDIHLALRARGHSPSALRANLSGPVRVAAWDGAWRGFDLAAARAALLPTAERGAMETGAMTTGTALREALAGGGTDFTQMGLEADIKDGLLLLRTARSTGPSGTVALSGQMGTDGRALDLRLILRPAGTNAAGNELPTLALNLNGQARAPGRVIDIADALRWLGAAPP